MITLEGENRFFDYFSGRLQHWAGKMAIGVGSTAASKLDAELDFHIADAPIDIIVPDYYNQLIVIRSVVPVELNCEIHEFGVYHERTPHAHRNIVSFDPAAESVVGGLQTFDSRAGASSLLAVSGDIISYDSYPLLLGNVAADDEFRLALNSTGGAATVVVRFAVDEENYYQRTFTLNVSAGYRVERVQKKSFSVAGSPDWDKVQQLTFTVTADVGTTLRFDGLRVGPKTSPQVLLAREVLTTPIRTQAAQETEIEYKVRLNFGS